MNIQQSINAAISSVGIASRMSQGYADRMEARHQEALKKTRMKQVENELGVVETGIATGQAYIEKNFAVKSKKDPDKISYDYAGRLAAKTKPHRQMAEQYKADLDKKTDLLSEMYRINPSDENYKALQQHKIDLLGNIHYQSIGPELEKLNARETLEAKGRKSAQKKQAEQDAVESLGIAAEEAKNSRLAVPTKLQQMGGKN